jgi:serine/threonine protein kinase
MGARIGAGASAAVHIDASDSTIVHKRFRTRDAFYAELALHAELNTRLEINANGDALSSIASDARWRQAASIVREFVLLASARHTPCEQNCVIFLNRAHGGDLESNITAIGRESTDSRRALCLQAITALEALHQIGVCHGDFKAKNLLFALPPQWGLPSVAESNTRLPPLRVCDVGGARLFAAHELIGNAEFDQRRHEDWRKAAFLVAQLRLGLAYISDSEQDGNSAGLLADADDMEDADEAAEEREREYAVRDAVLAREPMLRELLSAPCGQLSAIELRLFAGAPFPR